VVIQEVRREEGGSQPAEDFIFFYGNGNANNRLGTGFYYIRELDQQLGG
jgi:hypothetical protein